MVTHVPVVGILMIVNGAMLSVAAAVALGFAGVMAYATTVDKGPVGDDKNVLLIMAICYAAAGLILLISGVMHLIAGIRVRNYRSRTLAIVALFTNLLTMLFCYCLPTSIGMMIYGLIVLFNSDVVQAFQMADEGLSPGEIQYRFLDRRMRHETWDDDRPSLPPPPDNPPGDTDDRFQGSD